MSENSKLKPNLDEKSRKTLNLTVLQRLDPYIDQILITAAHVTFYQFNVHLNQWSRKDVEGSLFVVKRNAQPRFQFIVMNRRNTENLVEDILGDFDYELQVPYLLYRNAAHDVNGIWFYNPRECEDVANLFTRILGAYSKVAPQPKVKKSAFEELEAIPTSAVIERPLEPSFTTSSSKDVPEDSSFANFFGTAMKLGHHASSNSANSQQPYHNSTPTHLHSRVSSSPALNNPSLHIPLYTSPGMPLHETPDPFNSNNHVTNLIKPLSFFTPSSSASPLMPQPSPSVPGAPLQPPRSAQHNHGIPLLQPFPPPTPPSSLTPGPTSSPNNGALSRGQVRDALLMLAQDNQFIEMFLQALLKSTASMILLKLQQPEKIVCQV
ncbi:mRNA-decapping enzyme subunit 1, PH domain-like protein [Artemisia annua]|uniref:mRNA-decapping enzyme subunit 1, PH domain-like protein n=1 Tax=Artemisia annua TaxID=35608 RepID=A0A2U1KSE8_ARTAN|nr:mRNA-decapping enzyme subunit 1, PH domain-like protein [Artemisia annua]